MPEYQDSQQSGQDELTDHNYDGIQEYDNPIPGWWHLIFLGSIVFAVLYVIVFHLTSIVPDRITRYNHKVAAAEEAQFGKLRELPFDENKLRIIMGNEQWLNAGKSIFNGTCTVCHGKQAQGIEGLGFNLTDEKFLYIKEIMDIPKFIETGSPNKKMPPQTKLNENEIAMVAAYVASLRGTNVEGPAGAVTGEEIPPFPDPIKDEADG